MLLYFKKVLSTSSTTTTEGILTLLLTYFPVIVSHDKTFTSQVCREDQDPALHMGFSLVYSDLGQVVWEHAFLQQATRHTIPGAALPTTDTSHTIHFSAFSYLLGARQIQHHSIPNVLLNI